MITKVRILKAFSNCCQHNFNFYCQSNKEKNCFIGVHQKDLDSIAQRYKEISTKVFNQSALWGTSSLVWSHSYYDTALWEKMLKEYLGEEVLIKTSRNSKCPKVCWRRFLLRIF